MAARLLRQCEMLTLPADENPPSPARAAPVENAPKISFVIPVRNDAVRLRRCLVSIAINQFPADRIEIIVADNGSQDDSALVAAQAGARVLSLPGMAVGELRNRAAETATGEILAFVDADHEIAPEWLACAAAAFRDPTVGAVGALCQAPNDGTWVQRTYDLLRRRSAGIRDVDWLGSGNMAVRRAHFTLVGGFDTGLHTCEDVDLCRRLRHVGLRIVQDTRLRNVHLGDPATLGDLFRGELWRGRDNLRVSFRGPIKLSELPSAILPVAELGLIGMAIAGIAAGPRGLLVSALPSERFSWRRVRVRQRWSTDSGRRSALVCGQAFAVAATYDLARAVALIRPHGYQTRRRTV